MFCGQKSSESLDISPGILTMLNPYTSLNQLICSDNKRVNLIVLYLIVKMVINGAVFVKNSK